MSNYSVTPDFVLDRGELNVYLPVLPKTRELIQALWDMSRPRNEYFDQTQHGALVAVEWYFNAGPVMLKKLSKLVTWQRVFGEVGSQVGQG